MFDYVSAYICICICMQLYNKESQSVALFYTVPEVPTSSKQLLPTSRLIGLVGRVFANGPGDLGSIPGRVIPKTLKMVLDYGRQLYFFTTIFKAFLLPQLLLLPLQGKPTTLIRGIEDYSRPQFHRPGIADAAQAD